MPSHRRGWLTLTVAAMVIAVTADAVTACSTTVSGSASSTSTKTTQAAPSAPPAPAKPDPGNYPATPRPPLGAANTPFVGRLLDAQRMAGYVIGPWEVDPSLVAAYAPLATVIKGADALAIIADKPVVEAARPHGFVNGFVSARQSTGHTILRNAVLRFADPASATAAATDMNQAVLAEPPAVGAAPSPVPISGHPDALASNAPFTASATKTQWLANATSFTAHGTYVLMQHAESTQSLEEGTALIAKTLDLQIPLIDQFTPTAQADFPGLPLDPSGLLARTLPVSDKDAIVTVNATYDRRGEVHFQGDPIAAGTLFADTGMDVATMGRANVYRAADAAGAAKIVDEFAAEIAAGGATAGQPVTGVPGSRCLSVPNVGSYCVASAGRYAFEVPAAQRAAVAQMVAAQYLMLTAS